MSNDRIGQEWTEIFETVDFIIRFGQQKEYALNKVQIVKDKQKREIFGLFIHLKEIVCVGVTATRYVSLQHARPWLVHSYRNIKGRGLHQEEDNSNTLPLEQTGEQELRNDPVKDTEDDHPLPTEENPTTSKTSIESSSNDASVASSSSAAKGASLKRGAPELHTLDKIFENESEGSSEPKKRKLDDADIDSDGASHKALTETVSDTETKNKSDELGQSKKRKLGDTDIDLGSSNKAPEQAQGSIENSNTSDAVKGLAVIDSDATKAVGTGVGMRRSNRRKWEDFSQEPSSDKEPPKVSTYDRVRLLIQPWRKPEGGINKPIFKMMLESVMLFFMMKPGSGETALINRYKPYLQPMVLRNIVQILMDIGCICPKYLKRSKVSLFSTDDYEEKDSMEGEDVINHYLPAEDCLFKLGQFGKAMFPHAKWPDTTVSYG